MGSNKYKPIAQLDTSQTLLGSGLSRLGREYALNTPLIGGDPESASPTLGTFQQETVALSGAPVIEYARSRPLRGSLQASVRLADEAGRTFRARFRIEREMALRAKTMLTWDDYQRLFVD